MEGNNINVSFVGLESTESLKKYALEKLTKHQNLLTTLTSGEIILSTELASRGVKSDFRVDVNYYLSGRKIHVEEIGSDMYALIDTASDKLFRRLKRYHDKKMQWEGEVPWKVIEAEEALKELGEDLVDENEPDNYLDYVPKVAVRKKIKEMSPLVEAEAIELMELSGFDQYLFRNKDKENKICMLYKRKRGGYGIVEPEDDQV